MTNPDELLTLPAVAQIRKESIRTVRRRIAAGEIPAYRIGPKSIRVRAEDALAGMRLIPSA